MVLSPGCRAAHVSPTMVGMPSLPVFAPALRLVNRVETHPGTNGYVSTWGEQLAGCQPVHDVA